MRKLAIAAFYFTAAIFISHYMIPNDLLLFCFIVAAIFSLAGLLFHGCIRLRIMIALIAVSIGFLWSWSYSILFTGPYREFHDEIKTITAIITDYPVERQPRGYRVDAAIKQGNHPSTGIRIYYYSESTLEPGDVIEITARFRRTDKTDDGDRFDALISRGIFLSAYISGDIEVIGSKNGFFYYAKRMANNIALKINELFSDDVSPFLQALLIGKRDKLYQDTALNASLSASGIVHVVSISGMHISFLMGFLALVVRNKRLFSYIGIPVLFFFMAMTGFTPAVTRAGIMQVFIICAPVFKRESDSITSLSAALFVLLVSNPFSCASAGLQLSFAATLGIVLFTTRINSAVTEAFRGSRVYKRKIPKNIINFVTSGLATTIGALVLTLPLTVIHFGYVSLIAPVTNLLTIGAVSLAFPTGLIAVLFAFIFHPLGQVIAFPVTVLAQYITFISRILSSIPYSVIYSSNLHIILWLAYIYILFIALPLLRARARQYIYPGCIAIILLFTVILVSPFFTGSSDTSVTVLDVGQGMSVVLMSGEHTMLVDCGSNSGENAGAVAHEFLLNQGRTSIDLLAITHFHSDHVNGVEFLLSRISVSSLAVPDPEGSFIAEDIIELARKRGTDIIYVTETLEISLGDMTVFLYPPVSGGDENERGLSVLTLDDVTSLITGDMNSSSERSLLRFAALPKLDLLVVGHHGSRHSTSEELLAATTPDVAVIPVGRNSFGHPTPETLERLERFSVVVYRTDESGHVSISSG